MKLEKINYKDLKPKAQEIFNFQKVSATLADYGFTTMWLNNDWLGGDFLAVHIDGKTFLKVQLKGRLSFNRGYRGKDIYICFICDGETYLYPHDLILDQIESKISDKTYLNKGTWSCRKLTQEYRQLLEPYLL
jgi:hypothetical protein